MMPVYTGLTMARRLEFSSEWDKLTINRELKLPVGMDNLPVIMLEGKYICMLEIRIGKDSQKVNGTAKVGGLEDAAPSNDDMEEYGDKSNPLCYIEAMFGA
ncbi:general regulatory factor 12 [Prunus dulcis]|uniref:General regulatory factor 12 n=1 Tax=Prunus dulcis TaxID=3755 RepID=A0A4Y1R5J9_PRUDU|nr:general regulatory factor 12 [Prunus dulcis]